MTAWGSRLPFSLDLLIAEAKRRMRRRRLLIAAMALLLLGGALGATLIVSRPASPQRSAFSPSSASGQLPPLSGFATRRAFCGNRYSTCHSPDGKWSVVYTQTTPPGHPGGFCTLRVTDLATGRVEEIRDGTQCNQGIWIGHTYLVQVNALGHNGRVVSLDPPSRHITVLAHFDTYVVSPNGRWIAGESASPSQVGEPGPALIAVLSPANHTCRVVTQPHPPTGEIAVDRSPWEFPPFPPPPKGFKDPVVWRTVVQGGRKIMVVAGPGTGFTRNNRSVIVAEWQNATHPPRATQKRLVKFNLSSLHTPCPTSVAPHS